MAGMTKQTILIVMEMMMGNLGTAKGVTFFDVETTSLDPTRSAILQIAIITDKEDGTQEKWSTKIKPREVELRFADKQALKICGYNDEEWADAPKFEDVAHEIAKRLVWGPLVGHNIQFDIAHLTAAFNRRGWCQIERNDNIYEVLQNKEKKYKFGYPAIDTCALAYIFLPHERQNLDHLRTALSINTGKSHDALSDAMACREVFYNVISSKIDADIV